MTLPLDELSTTVRPQDDLWEHVNGPWADSDPIPADRARWGLSDSRRAEVARQLRELVRDADPASSSPEERAVARLYAAATDLETRDRLGSDPLQDELAAVTATRSIDELLRVLGERRREGVPGLCEVYLLPDATDPTTWSIHLFQGGLTLPVPPLYARLEGEVRSAATDLVAACGLPPDVGQRAIDLELAIAQVSWDRPDGDDDEALTNPMSWDDLRDLAGVDVLPLMRGLGCADPERLPLNVCQPKFWAGVGRLLRERSLEDWQAWAQWRIVDARAPLLSAAIGARHHELHGRALSGQAEQAPPWRRAVEIVQQHLGMPLARLWVERTLDPSARDRTLGLAERVRSSYRLVLQGCSWLSDEARERAVAKVDAVVLNIGWPREWPSLGDLDLPDGDLVGAVRAAARREQDRTWDKATRPVDREEWGPAPTTVNCFYNPMLNQLTVEGASLAAPSAFEDPAVLLGRYGSIIGHELGHALDSRGSQRDELGRVRDWWSADDRAAFEERAARVVADVDGCHPRGIEDAVVDGRLVGFEVVAELVGYQIAWDTYASMTTADERATPVDGFTGAQRFFLAKTYGRRGIDRPETARARLHGDVHPPFEVFANLARHLDAFHEAFATRPGDGMWLDPEDRVRVY